MESSSRDSGKTLTCMYDNSLYEIVAEHGDTYALKSLARMKIDGSGEIDSLIFVDKSEVTDVNKKEVEHVGADSLKTDMLYRMMFNFCKVVMTNQNTLMDLAESSRNLKVPVANTSYEINMHLSITKNENE